jgi:hypothetical protein
VFESRQGLGISLRHRVQTGSGAHPASHPMGTRDYFPGGKAAGPESDHSLPSSAEVKNVWSYNSTPPTRLRGVVLSWKKKKAQGELYLYRQLKRK